ncbi:helix-turn-helix domain-containing protein [Actinomadura sp. 3N508]|uniref:nSTAND1 domain-containing NTPase n=1 Tax=Actinomadura sp. 3N508 TaxID=3375153 RepID=UPI003790DD66
MDLDGDKAVPRTEPSRVQGEGGEVTFGTELRRLRQAADLSLAGLAKNLQTSKGYLSRLERGLQKPSEAFARACDAALGAGGALFALAVGPVTGRCPYPGLTSFRAEDARWFFGRERAVADLLRLLADPRTAGHPAVVVGPSGIGKTSLLRAGLATATARGALPARQPGAPETLYLTPTAHPLDELRGHDARRPLESYALVIVDQFEELFTLCADESEREAFIADLCGRAEAGLPVVFGVRADFYGHCVAHPPLLAALRARVLPLGPMTVPELRQAITEPAAAEGLALEPGLVEVLLRDLGAAPGEEGSGAGTLPLLSHALRVTWQHPQDGVLTIEGYERTGGVHGAVAATAEQVYQGLDEGARPAARRLLLRLVRVGDQGSGTRLRVSRSLLEGPQAETVLESFAAARLITLGDGTVEISHEALLRAWPRLREWIDADQVGLLVRQRLTDDAAAWQAAGRDDSHLYRGTRLAAAGEWHTAHPGQLAPLESAFLAAGHRQQRRGARRMRRLMAAIAALAVLAMVTAGFAVNQAGRVTRQAADTASARLSTQADAVRPKDSALAALLALTADRAARTPQARSALIGSSAPPYATRYVTGGRTDTTAWASSPDQRVLAEGTAEGTVRVWRTAGRRQDRPETVRIATGAITEITVHPRGVLAAVSEDNHLIRLWDVSGTRRPLRLPDLSGAPGPVTAIEFSPDGSRLVTGHGNGRLALWNTSPDPRHPRLLKQWQVNNDHILDVAVSRDGRRLATVEGDDQVTAWDVDNPGRPRRHSVPRLRGRHDFKTIALSSDGRSLALVNAAISGHPVLLARIAQDGETTRPRRLYESVSTVSDLAFSADGAALAVGDIDSRVKVWNVHDLWKRDGWKTAWHLTLDQPDQVVGLGFGPDGTSLAVGTRTQGIRLWRPLPPLAGHNDSLTTLEISRDRELALTTGRDGTARLWSLAAGGSPRPLGASLDCKGHPLGGAAFSPDRRTLALTTDAPDHSDLRKPWTWAAVCLWDVSRPERPRRLGSGNAHAENHINDAAFSSDGRTLVTGANGNDALIVWNVSDPYRPDPRTRLPVRRVTSLAFLGETSTLAVGTVDAGVQLWNVASPYAPRFLRRLANAPSAASLSASADGRILAAGSYDQRVYLWKAAESSALEPLPSLDGHRGTVLQVDLDTRGRNLLTTSGISPGPTRLWSLSDPRKPRPAAAVEGAHGIGVLTGEAGGFLVTTGDFSLRHWDTDPQAAARALCRWAGSPLTAEEHLLHGTGEIASPCG